MEPTKPIVRRLAPQVPKKIGFSAGAKLANTLDESGNGGGNGFTNKVWKLWAHLPSKSDELDDWTINGYQMLFQSSSPHGIIAITESLPEQLLKTGMLFWMRDGVNPMWEDDRNKLGGRFSYQVNERNVKNVWRDLTYALVGETLSSSEMFLANVNGITISAKRKFCIITVWMCNCDFQNPELINTQQIPGISTEKCLFKAHYAK